MARRLARLLGVFALATAAYVLGVERGRCAETTTVEAAGSGADEDAAVRDAAATALTGVFRTLLAQADAAEMQARIAAFVAADAAHVAVGDQQADASAIRRVEVVKAVSEDDTARVLARFTISLDYLKDEIAQLRPNGQSGEIWICPILGRCGPPGTPGLGSWLKTKQP